MFRLMLCCHHFETQFMNKGLHVFTLHGTLQIINSIARPTCSGPCAAPKDPHSASVTTGCVCACSVAQLCPTLCDPVDCSLPGASVPGILQARRLERVAISSFSRSSQPRDWTHDSCISCIGRWILYH